MNAARLARPDNRLLTALPPRIRRELLASCEQVELPLAHVVYQPDEPIAHAYFPLSGFVSLVNTLENGRCLTIGMIGNEGMLGTPLVLEANTSPQQAVVHGAGTALRVNAAAFLDRCKMHIPLRRTLERYIYVLMSQLAQTAACAHYHSVEARLACWLLLTRDRAHSRGFHLTHERLAFALGVRRVGITRAASSLQARELIEYTRGAIVILDDAALERIACACYRAGNAVYEQTLGARRGRSASSGGR